MRKLLQKRKVHVRPDGFSTFEIVIALAVAVMIMSAVIIVSFGNQSLVSDSQTSNEALLKAQGLLEEEQALARKDFKLVNPTPQTQLDPTAFCPAGFIRDTDRSGNYDIYCKRVDVQTQPDFLTKKVTATVTWAGDHNRMQHAELSTLVTNFNNAIGGDTCDSVLSGDWTQPQIKNSVTNFAQLVGDPLGAYPVADEDASRGKLYVAVQGVSQQVGPRNAGAGSNDTSNGSAATWSSLGNIGAQDGNNVLVTLSGGGVSSYLKANNFGFNVPLGATILGIQVDIWRSASVGSAIKDSEVKIVKADGSIGSKNQALPSTWSAGNTQQTYGGTSDLWDVKTWQPSEINSPNFGAVIAVTNTAGLSRTAKVDAIQITVTYINQLYVFNVASPANPTFVAGLKNNPVVGTGFNAIAVAGNYAYAATNSGVNQLQVLDIVASPPVVTSTYQVAGSAGVGNSIFYKDGFIYLGLIHSGSGPEFNIIDVHNPLAPFLVGSYAIGYSVNAIYVRGNYAYVAHTTNSSASPQEQMTVLNIAVPGSPQRVSGFFHTPGINNAGKSIYGVGDTVYLGRLASKISGSDDTIPEFYALDASNPAAIPSTALETIPLATPESLHDLIVRDTLAFFITTHKFQVWDVSTPTPVSKYVLNLPASGGSVTPSLDCEGNYLFAGANDSTNKGYLFVIAP